MKVKSIAIVYFYLSPFSMALADAAKTVVAPPPHSDSVADWARVLVPSGIAVISLLYSHHTSSKLRLLQKRDHDKDYALKAFERDVAEPVVTALWTLTGLTTSIIKICHEQKMTERLKLFGEIEGDILPKILDARRHCREADLYLLKRGINGPFELDFNGHGDEFQLDDIIFSGLSDAVRSTPSDSITIGNEISDAIADRKAQIRSLLTDMGEKVAKEAYLRQKNQTWLKKIISKLSEKFSRK